MTLVKLHDDATIRRIVTPEGVALPFAVAAASERILAFLIDLVLIHASVAAIYAIGFFAATRRSTLPLALAMVASFFLRNCYFVYMEMRWGGQTLGKRRMGLRVISRDGGPLTAEAIFARNLTRDFEVFLPLVALLQPRLLVPTGPMWGALIGCGWLFAFAMLPLFSKDRLRCGDIVGGTMVVHAPAKTLLADLAHIEPPASSFEATTPAEARYTFTPAQLDHYGIHELQVLERVLRRSEGYRDAEVVQRVCDTIMAKIDWRREQRDADPHEFLFAFYKAQRARLEHGMLLGKRRERKKGA